jgi:uncharacterized caspase-like protein
MRLLLLICVFLLTMVGAACAASEKRVALVIGVEHYQNAPALPNPANDARLIGTSLEKLGFDVQTVIDPDYETMKRALRDFGRRLDGAAVATFYYAGHGIQVAGRNYLLPIDAALMREADLRYEAFELQAVLDEMDAPGRTNIIFLDACRDNPLRDAFSRRLGSRGLTVGQGLASVETQSGGILIAYATAPGNVALDGEGANSPFTAALARHIATPGLEVRQMLTRVLADVQTATGSEQRPWVNESLDADFYFVSKPDRPAAAEVGASPEIVFWQSISGSTNPADFSAYIKQFPQGSVKGAQPRALPHFSLASIRRRGLSASCAAATRPFRTEPSTA